MGGLQWFGVVCGGLWWFAVVCGNSMVPYFVTAMLRLKFIVQGNCYLKILQHIKHNFGKTLF